MNKRDFFQFALVLMFMAGFFGGGCAATMAWLPHVDTEHMKDGKTWKGCK